MSRPKRDDRTKDTIEVVNKAGNRARVDPDSAAESYFKARGYKLVEEEAEEGKAALLRPRGASLPVPTDAEKKQPEPDKAPRFGDVRVTHEAEKPEPLKGKGKE